MSSSLASLITKNQEKIVDQAATSIKVMYGFAFADVATEDLRDRIHNLLDNLAEITKKGEVEPDLLDEFTANVMVGSLYEGFDNRSITEEVLQIVDMVINKTIDTKLNTPELAEDNASSKVLLAKVIRSAKDVANRRNRQMAEKKAAKRAAKQGAPVAQTPEE